MDLREAVEPVRCLVETPIGRGNGVRPRTRPVERPSDVGGYRPADAECNRLMAVLSALKLQEESVNRENGGRRGHGELTPRSLSQSHSGLRGLPGLSRLIDFSMSGTLVFVTISI